MLNQPNSCIRFRESSYMFIINKKSFVASWTAIIPKPLKYWNSAIFTVLVRNTIKRTSVNASLSQGQLCSFKYSRTSKVPRLTTSLEAQAKQRTSNDYNLYLLYLLATVEDSSDQSLLQYMHIYRSHN